MGPRVLVVVALAALGACGRASRGGVPTVPPVEAVPRPAPPSQEPSPRAACRIDIVDAPPPDSARVGVTDIPADPAVGVVLDPDARSIACGLGATHAVRERAFTRRDGGLRWQIGLFRIGAAGGGGPRLRDGAGPPPLPEPQPPLPRPPPEGASLPADPAGPAGGGPPRPGVR